jgi:hypothetical protein
MDQQAAVRVNRAWSPPSWPNNRPESKPGERTMQKTIIFGALAALLGFAAAAQASDDDRSLTTGAGQVAQERMSDGRYADHDRYERREHARNERDNHDDDRNGHREGRERNRQDRD